MMISEQKHRTLHMSNLVSTSVWPYKKRTIACTYVYACVHFVKLDRKVQSLHTGGSLLIELTRYSIHVHETQIQINQCNSILPF